MILKLWTKVLQFALGLGLAFSCKEKKNTEDPYTKPWDTRFISMKNTQGGCGTHSSSYNVRYKDRVVEGNCIDMDYCQIKDSCRFDSQIMFLFGGEKMNSMVLSTRDGGENWTKDVTGGPDRVKYQHVSPKLSYCITKFPSLAGARNWYWITGIGKSALKGHLDTLARRINIIYDKGTEITTMDSTVIVINDTIKYIVRFK